MEVFAVVLFITAAYAGVAYWKGLWPFKSSAQSDQEVGQVGDPWRESQG